MESPDVCFLCFARFLAASCASFLFRLFNAFLLVRFSHKAFLSAKSFFSARSSCASRWAFSIPSIRLRSFSRSLLYTWKLALEAPELELATLSTFGTTSLFLGCVVDTPEGSVESPEVEEEEEEEEGDVVLPVASLYDSVELVGLLDD